MKNPSETVLKAFLSRCEPERQRALERFLPDEERERLDQMASFSQGINPELFSHEEMLEKVHWSWFLPTLKTYPEEEQKLFLSALPPPMNKNLADTLELTIPSQEISSVASAYFREILLNSLLGPNHRLLPAEYLPYSPLQKLLTLSKKELTRIITLLSLHDLAAELRQIVETKILKKIYSFLSEEERKFLKGVVPQKDHFVLGKMGLDRWDGLEESLHTLLHRRGLARMGAALSGQDPDFIWHICHQLDIGRGSALFKLCVKEPIHGVTDEIIRQIEELIR